jgi:mannose-6-phosphate isomerase-like protein (cupin superfamily)
MDAATIEGIDTDEGSLLAERREVVTGPATHVDVVEVPPGGQIGSETHADADETLVVVTGEGVAELDGERMPVRAGSLIFIPRGTPHNVVNPRETMLRLYAVHASTT